MHPRFGADASHPHDVAVLRFPEAPFEDVTPVELPRAGMLERSICATGRSGSCLCATRSGNASRS